MLTSLTGSSPDTSPTRLPVRQKNSLASPKFPIFDLPPLPPITNPGIRRMALTHSSCHSGDKRRNRELITNPDEAVLDYEKLEHVGDGLLTAAIVTLLHDKYPAFGPGPATYLRGNMVSNRALSQIAEQYKIPEMVIAEQASKYMLQGGEKIKGSLFEAYIAGVYYSFLLPREGELEVERKGVEGESREGPSEGECVGSSGVKEERSNEEVLKVDSTHEPLASNENGRDESTTNPTTPSIDEKPRRKSDTNPNAVASDSPSAKVIASQLQSPSSSPSSSPSEDSTTPTPTIKPSANPTTTPTVKKTHGQAFDHICSWLWPLFHPVAIFLMTQLRSDPHFSCASASALVPCPDTLNVTPPGLYSEPAAWKVEDEIASGGVGALNQFLGKNYGCGVLPTWITKSKGQQVWKLTCIVRTPEGQEIKSEAKRLTKRKAMNIAAYNVWQLLKKLEEEESAKRAEEEGSSDDDHDDVAEEKVGGLVGVKVVQVEVRKGAEGGEAGKEDKLDRAKVEVDESL